MILDILVTLGLLAAGLLSMDNLLGPVLIFAAGGWAMFTLWIERRE